jgi:hypothetical protein
MDQNQFTINNLGVIEMSKDINNALTKFEDCHHTEVQTDTKLAWKDSNKAKAELVALLDSLDHDLGRCG